MRGHRRRFRRQGSRRHQRWDGDRRKPEAQSKPKETEATEQKPVKETARIEPESESQALPGPLHERIANQRKAVLHEASDLITRKADVVVIEDLNVKGMVANRSLARAISDAGFGALRAMIEYKAKLRGVTVMVADRWFPAARRARRADASSRILRSATELFSADCGLEIDRDRNALLNLQRLHTFAADEKRTQESNKTASAACLLTA